MQQQVIKIWIVKQIPGRDTWGILFWWDIHLDPSTLAWVSGLPKKHLILRLPEPLPAKADLVQLTFANLYETKLPNALPIFKSLLSRNKLPRSKLSLLLNWDASKFNLPI